MLSGRHVRRVTLWTLLLVPIFGLSTPAFGDDEELRTPEEQRLDDALHHYRTASGRGPELEDRLAESEDLFQAIIDDYPHSEVRIDATYHRSMCQRRLQRPEAAKEGFLIFLQLRLEGDLVTDALHYLGHCYQDLREWQASLDPFGRVYEEFPEDLNTPACLYDAGKSLRELGRFDEARVLWQRVIDEHPDHSYARRARKGLPTLRPARERLEPLIEEYQGYVDELRKGSIRKKKDIITDLGTVLGKVGEIHDRLAERFLISVFKRQSGGVQAAAVKPLLAVGGTRAAELLIGQLAELGEKTQLQVLKGLNRSHVKGMPLLKAFRPYVSDRVKPSIRQETVKFLGRVRNLDAVKLLVEAIFLAEDRESLSKIGRSTNDLVLRALRDVRDRAGVSHLCVTVKQRREHIMRRLVVAEALGFSRSTEGARALISVLGDPVSDLARAAVVGLGRLQNPESVDPILTELRRRRNDRDFLIAALGALSRLEPRNGAEDILSISRLGDPEVRAIAVKALGGIADIEPCFQRLLESLSDPAWQVRQAALEAVKLHRRKEIVDVLVIQLGKEDGLLRLPVVKLLINLTGADLGPDAKAWQEYWAVARETWKDPEIAEGSKGPGKTYVRRANPDIESSEYFGVEIISKKLAFIIDVSGSMSQSVTVPTEKGGEQTVRKIDLAKEELVGAIGSLKGGTQFNLVRFHSNFNALWKKPTRLSPKSAKAAKRFVNGLQPAGATNIYDSLESVLKSGGVDTIYLLSDGSPTAGRYTDPGQILEEIKRLNGSKQLTIHTIALGYESDFLRRLAEQNRGEYVVAGQSSGGKD